MATKPRSRSRVSGMIAGALGILLVIAIALATVIHFNPEITKALEANISQSSADGGTVVGKSVGTADKDAKEKLSKDELAAIAKSMTVHKDDAQYKCAVDTYGNIQFKIGSKLPTPDSRIKPDAISTPIKSTNIISARAELQKGICEDPLLGNGWKTFLATEVRDQLLKATGLDLLELNPELKSSTDVTKVKSQAQKFDPLEFAKNPSDEDIKDAITQNKAWQQEASLVNTLLERFMVTGIESRKSLVNYHLIDYSLAVNSFADIGINDKEESLPALIFTIVEKGQCGEITAFGANTGDKRPELFTAKECKPDVTTPSCKKDCTTDTPECKTNCNPTPECTKNCLTPKSDDKKDYVYPKDKPKVTSPGPADKEKPKVDTEKTGGGGVKDTPTKDKGDETGVQAPDTTKPPVKPTPPPVNEGGDN